MLDLKPFLPLFFSAAGVLILFITFKLKLERDTKKNQKISDRYFTKEANALFARKKEIPESIFISVDFHNLPTVDDAECTLLYKRISITYHYKMTNLKDHTNLELKEAYGMAHFQDLTIYEKNYLTFMDILLKYGSILYEKGFIKEARTVLEAALDYQCDVSKCYMILSDIYLKLHARDALENLACIAKQNMQGSPYLNKVLNMLERTKQA